MRLLFGAHGSILKVFCELDSRLREQGLVDKSAYWISDSQYYYANHEEFALLSDPSVNQLHEWRFTHEPQNIPIPSRSEQDRLDELYGAHEFWNAVLADRRLMYGPLSKVKQDYYCAFDHSQLSNIVYATLSAMDDLVEQLNPEAIVTFVPASYGDYLLYVVAKARGIHYLQLRSTKIDNFITFSDRLNALSSHIERRYASNLTQGVGYRAEEEAGIYLSKASTTPVVYEGTIKPKRENIFPHFISTARGFASALKRAIRPVHPVVKKDNHVPPPLATFVHSVVLKNYYENRSLRTIQMRMISVDDVPTDPYVFFPLHSEPEIALSIYGRDHQNQIESIRRLAQSLPIRWRLIIKEHPRSLSYRSTSYYKHLLNIPNVYFADPKTRPFPWIERAQAVATVSGFVGFEALMIGRPVLVLGDVSYSMLPDTMVRRVCSASKIARELDDLISNFSRDENALRAFIAACMEEGVAVNLYSELLGKKGRESVKGDEVSVQLAALTDLLCRRLEECVHNS